MKFELNGDVKHAPDVLVKLDTHIDSVGDLVIAANSITIGYLVKEGKFVLEYIEDSDCQKLRNMGFVLNGNEISCC